MSGPFLYHVQYFRTVRESEREVLDFLSRRKFTVLFSGGKDSLASLLWVLEYVNHNNWDILYIEIPENTHPECTAYVKKVCEDLDILGKLRVAKREDLEFYACLRKWGIPMVRGNRWCLWKFKMEVMLNKSHIVQVTGMRRGDSVIRKVLRPVHVFRLTSKVGVQPLLEWSKEEVIDFIKDHGVKVNPCYTRYGHSGNCMFCPYLRRDQIVRTLADPEWREKILDAMKVAPAKGPWTRKIKEKWLKLANQVTLVSFLEK